MKGEQCGMNTVRNDAGMKWIRSLFGIDKYTSRHSQNVAGMMYTLAACMDFSPAAKEAAYIAGLVHDIGKIDIPLAILQKPGTLTAYEYNIMKCHPELGVRILGQIGGFDNVLDAIRHHHERYDGKGYPVGKQGNSIPLLSRMLAVCDSFDAMISKRCYRQPNSLEEALNEIKRCAGKQFDPAISWQFLCMQRSIVLKKR
jgi:putative nucleotidyltransferase with HDIG domain